MRFKLPDFCLEEFPATCRNIRSNHHFRFVSPIDTIPGNQIQTVNGLKVKSINIFAAHTYDKDTPLPAAGDGTIVFFEIETEEPPTEQTK